MSKTRSEILQAARRAGWCWKYGTAQATRDRLEETHKILFDLLEDLAEATTRGETSNDTIR